MTRLTTPFGKAGLRVLIGLENDAHYGFNSGILDAGDGKWVIPYRRGPNHAVSNGSEFRAVDSYDNGETLVNDRLIYKNPNVDTRCSVSRVMANGRLGILATRRAGAGHYGHSIFMYSDDAGVTWDFVSIPPPLVSHGINFHGNMIDFPASVGGDDVNGFIAYSYGSTSGNVDALSTIDNGATWTWTLSVAAKGHHPSLTEAAVSRVGTQNKWIMLVRPTGVIDANGAAFVSDNPLSFPTLSSAGVGLAGNPPQTLYDDETGLFWYTSFARRDRGWKRGAQVGIENVFLVAAADGDDLYAAGGDMSTLGLDWQIACYLPDWASGYLHPYKIDGKWWGTFVCGEDYPDHRYSKLCLIGDFIPTGLDNANIAWMFQWSAVGSRATYRKEVEIGFGVTPPTVRGFLTLATDNATPGISIQTFTTSSRIMIKLTNSAGTGGNVSLSGGDASYGT